MTPSACVSAARKNLQCRSDIASETIGVLVSDSDHKREWARTEARAQVVSGEMSAYATIAAAWFKVAKAPGMNETSASMRQLKRINMAGSLSDRVRDKRDVIRRIGLAM